MVNYLRSIEPTMAIAYRTVETPQDLVWTDVADALVATNHQDNYLIAPTRFVPEMLVHRIDTPIKSGFSVMGMDAPALLYSPGRLAPPNRLYTTALSADWSYLGEGGKTVDKSAEFIHWGKQVMQWVRRSAPAWYRYKSQRLTTKAEAARERGLELVW